MSKLYAGVDLGGTSMIAIVADSKGRILGSAGCATNRSDDPAPLIEQIAAQVEGAAADARVKLKKIEAIGIGAPGAVDRESGVVVRAPNLGWSDVPLSSELQKLLGPEVVLGNDVQVALLGEHAFGAARGFDRVAGIWIGTGIGGGLVIDGRLSTGARGAAGEIGHVVYKEDGPLCGCGKRGCFEAFASRTAIEREVRARSTKTRESAALRIMRERDKPRMTSSVLARALEARDRIVTKVMAEAEHAIGILTANIVNIIDPEMVVIGGGIAQRLQESFVDPIRETARSRFLRPDPDGAVRIEHAILGDHSGALGATVLARHGAL